MRTAQAEFRRAKLRLRVRVEDISDGSNADYHEMVQMEHAMLVQANSAGNGFGLG